MFVLRDVPPFATVQAYCARFGAADPRGVEAYLFLVSVSGKVRETAESFFSRHGLSRGRFMALLQLDADTGGNGLQPSELAERLGVTRATVTGLLDGLERDGLVRREPSKFDRRSMIAALTPRGTELVERMLPGRMERIDRFMAILSEEEKQALAALLRKLGANITALQEEE